MNIQTYKISGMTCNGCVKSVKSTLEEISNIENVHIDLSSGIGQIMMKETIDVHLLQKALSKKGEYKITNLDEKTNKVESYDNSTPIYKRLYPLFLVFSYLIGFVILSQVVIGDWNFMTAMRYFMGGFFISFSFFKLLDLKGFAHSFSSYDPITRKWIGYGYLYPFIELLLGIGYILGNSLWMINLITLGVLIIGTYGVAQSLLKKRKIQCACLGTVFNLPMTTVTLTENTMMIVMAILMLVQS